MESQTPETLPGASKVARVTMTVGVALLIGAGLLVYFSWSKRQAIGEGMELPLNVPAGGTVQAPFKTSARFPFQIQFTLGRSNAPRDKATDEALFGTVRALNIEWSVRDRGVVIASGSSATVSNFNAYAAYYEKADIGWFKPPRHGTYEFNAKVNSNLPGPERAQPRLIVKSIPGYAVLIVGYGYIAGIVLAVVGLFLILQARREQRSAAN